MAFIRAKKVNGSRYFYLVENSWSDGKVKQQVIQYLGKADTALQKLKSLKLPKPYFYIAKQKLLAELGKRE